MKILIDDERYRIPGDDYPDILARSFEAAIRLFEVIQPDDEIWLDHDLGDPNGFDGYHWITLLEANLHYHPEKFFRPARITCVSMNPPGRARIQQVIGRLYEK